MKKILATTIVLLSFTSCFLVHICIENDKSFKKCLKYPQYTPVTVAEFADILHADSLHYKLVFMVVCVVVAPHGLHTTFTNH